MVLRVLQILLAVGNCVYGVMLMERYGPGVLPWQWPPLIGQDVLLLIGISVLPAAIIGLRYPVFAGIVEFACAFIGLQMAHDEFRPNLKHFAHVSMILAAAVLAVAVLRGITEVTDEAFGEGKEGVKGTRRAA